MKPLVIAIDGPSRGASSTLDQREFFVGRDSGNHLLIEDDCVSARHCAIRNEDGIFSLVDLQSRNGTLVNGVAVEEKILAHGDRISIGESVLTFILPSDAEPCSAELVENPRLERAAVRMRAEGTLCLRPEKAALSPSTRREKDLHTLLTIASKIATIRDTESLQWQVLGMVFDNIPAERGAFLLLENDPTEFKSSVSWNRKAGPNKPVQVSRELVRQVIADRAGLLLNPAAEEADTTGSDSQVVSVMCVPLQAADGVLGAIYVETANPNASFDAQHLVLLSAIAGIAALALSTLSFLDALVGENRKLREDLGLEHEIIGKSKPIAKVLQFIAKAAPSDSTILIEGESGTGKELVARAVYRNSLRSEKAFIALNCAAFPENLLESELFGYEKGAFTGAVASKKGLVEAAEGGTLFLDEIGELAPVLQAKLLRVLQEREFMRLGGTHPIKINVRLIAATNRELAAASRQGRFRQDLYFRLNVVSIKLPALRERAEDIALLAGFFVTKFARKCKRPIRGISPEGLRCLTAYDWPGNVRELENAIERAVVMGSGELLLPDDLPEAVLESGAKTEVSGLEYHAGVKHFKSRLISRALEESNWNYVEAAKRLGVQLTYLYRLVRNLDLKSNADELSKKSSR